MGKSELEAELDNQLRLARLPEPEREWRFHPVRRWRFDFSWPDVKLAVEVEGGVWSLGRHLRGGGFTEDCVKYNEAALLGWTVLRFTGGQIKSGMALEQIERALAAIGAR